MALGIQEIVALLSIGGILGGFGGQILLGLLRGRPESAVEALAKVVGELSARVSELELELTTVKTKLEECERKTAWGAIHS